MFILFVKKVFVPKMNIQLAQLIPGRSAFYAMICGYFDQLKVLSKVMQFPWASGSTQI